MIATGSQPHVSRQPLYWQATPAGAGGIATLLLDGENLAALLQPFFHGRKTLEEARSGDLLFGRIVDSSDRVIDEVIVAPVGANNTPTGNEQIELSCHGGFGAVAAIEELLSSAGFLHASGTQLLERAHLNCRLSLVAIEAHVLLSRAVTARQADMLLSHAQFQKKWERQGFEMTLGLRNRDVRWREPMLQAAQESLEHGAAARRLLARHHLVITGPVNAGKSTLANRLAQMERHIVSDIPGTTRDRVDTPLSIRGLNVLLSDTAGMRDVHDEIERQGQRRAAQAASESDLRLIVLDASRSPAEAEIALIRQHVARPFILVLNKHDLGVDEAASGLGFIAGREPLQVSAQSGFGMDALEDEIEKCCLGTNMPLNGAPFTRRQCRHLEILKDGLTQGLDGAELLMHVRKLIGSRPDNDELSVVLAEAQSWTMEK